MNSNTKSSIKKKVVTAVFLLIAIAATTVTALAVWSSISDKDNSFLTGTQSIEITESEFKLSSDDLIAPNRPINKNPTITNTGKNTCFVRACIIFSDISLKDNTSFNVNGEWELKDDGYYYLSVPLAPNKKAVLFDFVTVSGVEHYQCDISIYAESIDAESLNFEQDWANFGVAV